MASTSTSSKEVEEESRPLLSAEPAAQKSAESAAEGGEQVAAAAQPLVQTVRPNKSILRQVFLGVVVALPSLAPGMSFGYSAVSIDQLRLTLEDTSWFASVTAMSYPVGSLVVGPLMDRWGRRPALLSINLVSLVGWLLLSVHTARPTLLKLLSGRVLTGVAGGLASVPASVYAAECLSPSGPRARSSVVTWSTVALSAGIFLVYATGSFLPYYAVASIAALVSIVSFVLVAIFVTESPVWLASEGRLGDAEWSRRELGLAPPPSRESTPPPDGEGPPPVPKTFRDLRRPEAYKPLLIMIGFFFFQQFSGVFVVIAYMVDVVRAAGVVTVDPYSVTVLGGTVVLLVALSAGFVYPTTGVRSLAALSGAGTAATMLFLGAYLEFRPYWSSTSGLYFLNWIPFFAVLANIAVSTVGFLVLPWSMMGEVFPLGVKGVAAGIATCAGFLFGFAAAKVYPSVHVALGTGGMFFFFGVMALLGTVYVVLFLPETRGKTLQEILDGFSSTRDRPATSDV